MQDPGERSEAEAIELARIAELYYHKGLKQAEIAEQLSISKMQVSRLLRRALDLGIVEIRVHYPLPIDHERSAAVARGWGLDEAIVVDARARGPGDALARAAAQYLVAHLTPHTTLAVAWSSTVAAMADVLPAGTVGHIRVVQMVGALTMSANRANPFDACRKLGVALAAETFPLHAPAFLESTTARATLLGESAIAETLALARKADCAIIGVGNTNSDSTFCRAGFVTPREMEALADRGAVGDVLGQFFDASGEPVAWRLSDNVVGLTLEDLRRIPNVIGVAGGADKHAAILGALRARLLSVLITDEGTADYLISEAAAQPRAHATGRAADQQRGER